MLTSYWDAFHLNYFKIFQLDAFRELLSYGREEKRPVDEFEGKILTNFRPPLETGSRTVRACSFK